MISEDLKDRLAAHKARQEFFTATSDMSSEEIVVWVGAVTKQIEEDRKYLTKKCETIKIALDKKRAAQLRLCAEQGFKGTYDELSSLEGLGQIFKDNKLVKRAMNDLDKGGELQRDCDQIVKMIEAVLASQDLQTQLSVLKDLQEALEGYNNSYYKIVKRVLAHNALVIMAFDHKRTVSLPVWTGFLGENTTTALILQIFRAVEKRLFDEGWHLVVTAGYDGQMSGDHRLHGETPLNKLQLMH